MIIYLHGFDSTSPGNHEKVLQLQFIDPDVRFISYSTLHPRHDMQHLLKEVDKAVQQGGDAHPLICGVGLGGFWAERIGFLCGIRQAMFNPNLYPEEHMHGKIDRPEEYRDIATKCVEDFREKTAIAVWWCCRATTRCWITGAAPNCCITTTRSCGMNSRRTSSKTSLRICSGSRRSRRWVNSFITLPRAARPVFHRRKVRLFLCAKARFCVAIGKI